MMEVHQVLCCQGGMHGYHNACRACPLLSSLVALDPAVVQFVVRQAGAQHLPVLLQLNELCLC